MDTRATSHLRVDSGILKSISDNNVFPLSILVGVGSSIPVIKISDTTLLLPNPYHTLLLKNVLVTPQIIKNLIYVRHFTLDNKCIIEFEPFGFFVEDLWTRQTLMRCESTDDLYPVTKQTPQAFVSSTPQV